MSGSLAAHYGALVESKFLHSFVNSVVSSCVSTAVALIVGTPAAYVLSRWRFRARTKIAMWILSTRMAPQNKLLLDFGGDYLGGPAAESLSQPQGRAAHQARGQRG